MALQTEIRPVTYVDDKGVLPFRLRLTVGKGHSLYDVEIDKLTQKPSRIRDHSYPITELIDLQIDLFSEEDIEVQIVWNTVNEHDSGEATNTFTLNRATPTRSLFTAGSENVESYPWRCGHYHFEVTYNEEVFYGGFTVEPKNVNSRQWDHMYQAIEAELAGLTQDYLAYKHTYGSPDALEHQTYWRYYQWYKKNESQLLSALLYIEQQGEAEFVKKYELKNDPVRIDHKSMRWENTAKGCRLRGRKYLNRVFRPTWDHSSNRLVKQRVRDIVKQLDAVSQQIHADLRSHQASCYEKESQLHELDRQRRFSDSIKTVTRTDKQRLASAVKIREKEIDRLMAYNAKLEGLIRSMQRFKQTLTARIQTAFWQSVRQAPFAHQQLAKGAGYVLFHQLWREAQRSTAKTGVSQIALPVHQPTYLLYEYYVFFVVISVFRELGFDPYQETLSEQLLGTFFDYGLQDGSTVSLIKDGCRVDVVYDEQIAYSPEVALKHQTHFYSRGTRRKPDVRIDFHHLDEQGTAVYQSSFIIEVKYSPFHNLYTTGGRTRAMEQMDEYWNIKYAFRKNGKVDFNHQPIANVFCIYPGDVDQPQIMNRECGYFLQIHPKYDAGDIHDIAGKAALKESIEAWVSP